jgi:hypothetical protein
MSYEDDEDYYGDQDDQDYQDDYDDYEDKDDINLVAEVAAIERVGGGGIRFIDIEIDVEKGRKGRLSLKAELSPDQLFLFDLQKSYNKYKEDISIGAGDIEIIKNIVPRINHVSYKNPDAFLLGYYVFSQKTQDINETKLTQVKSLLKDVEEIKIEDIIRYTRLIKRYM